MSKAYVEIDFFQMEKMNMASPVPSSPRRAPSSLRGIQRFVSRINPHVMRTIIAAGSVSPARPSDNAAALPTSSNPTSPIRTTSPRPLLVCSPGSRCCISSAAETAPLTIFYNGTVATFDIPRDKAEAILRVAETAVVGKPAETAENSLLDGNELDEATDLPIARKKSLQRFLDKRKERLVSASPYHRVGPHRPR